MQISRVDKYVAVLLDFMLQQNFKKITFLRFLYGTYREGQIVRRYTE